MGARQQQWLAATQRRLKSTKHMLDSLKGIKMTSQDGVAYDMLNNLRTAEIQDSAPFRWIVVLSCFLCKFSIKDFFDLLLYPYVKLILLATYK
jgi:hypothetical protein